MTFPTPQRRLTKATNGATLSRKPVFFNLFCEAEAFAAILIAHGTHVFWGTPEAQNSRLKAESGRGVLGGSLAKGLGERCNLPQQASWQGPDHRYTLDLLRAYKTRLVAANVGCSLVFLLSTAPEPLDTTGRTPVEKHCCRQTSDDK